MNVKLDMTIEIDGKLYKPSVQCYKPQDAYHRARYCLDLEEIKESDEEKSNE